MNRPKIVKKTEQAATTQTTGLTSLRQAVNAKKTAQSGNAQAEARRTWAQLFKQGGQQS